MPDPEPIAASAPQSRAGLALAALSVPGLALGLHAAASAQWLWPMMAALLTAVLAAQALGVRIRPVWLLPVPLAVAAAAALQPASADMTLVALLAGLTWPLAMAGARGGRGEVPWWAAVAAGALIALVVVSVLGWHAARQPWLVAWTALVALLLGGSTLHRTMPGLVAAGGDRTVLVALLLQAGVATLVLLGWLLESATVVQAATRQVPMQFNTAACHLLAAAALAQVLRGNRRIGLALLLPIIVTATLTLAEEHGGLSLGVDQLVWEHRIVGELAPPGRMSSITALVLLVGALGIALASRARPHSVAWPLVWTCGLLICIAALTVLAGTVLAIPQARALGGRTPMALLTALAFCAQGIALLCAGRGAHNRARHQRVWLPVLVLGGALVLVLQVGLAVVLQREELAQRSSEQRADSVRRSLKRGLDVRMQALTRIAERLQAQPVQAATGLFQTDAALYARDFPSLAGLALVTPDLAIETVFERPTAPFAWADLAALHQSVIEQVRVAGVARLSAPVALRDGSHAGILVIPLQVAPGAADDARFLSAVIAYDVLLDAILDGLPGALLIEDAAVPIVARGQLDQAGTPLRRQLQVYGRSWTLHFLSPAQAILDRVTLTLLLGGLLAGATLAMLLRYSGLARERAVEAEASRNALALQFEQAQRMRAALAKSEHNLAGVLESMTDAVVLLDAQWRYVYLNTRAGQLLARAPAELVGQSIWEAFPEAVGGPFEQAYRQAVAEQRTTVVESWFEPLQMWIEARAYPHGGGVAVYFRDVTAARIADRAQAKLRLEAERAARLARLGSWEYEPDSARLHCSPLAADILGLADRAGPSALDQMFDAVHAEDRELVRSAHQHLASAGHADGDLELRYRVHLPEGRIGHVHELATRICDAHGQLLSLNGAVQDVSQLRTTEMALREAVEALRLRNRELQDFAFVASHDLQEPLRKIRSFADRLLQRAAEHTDPRSQDYLTRMSAAAARMQTLIEDLLAFSRVSQQAAAFVDVDLAAVMAAVLEDLSERIRSSGARVTVGPLPVLKGDATQLRQLLQNLLANALKFHAAGRPPIVEVDASASVQAGGMVWILRVRDNGIGFDDKHAERIFAPLQRLHGRADYEGTGIGLAIVRRIAERHHGRIKASGVPGEGAVFTVTLPARQPGTGLFQAPN